MDLNFWTSIAGIISGLLAVLSFVVGLLSTKQKPQLCTSYETRIEVVRRIEHVHQTKVAKSRTPTGLSQEPLLLFFGGIIVFAMVAFCFSKHLHQIQTFVVVLASVVLFASTVLVWFVRVRGIYPITTNAYIILATSVLTWVASLMVFSPMNSANIGTVAALHRWTDLTQNLNDVSWMGIAFNALGVALFSLVALAILVQMMRTLSIVSHSEWLNRLYINLDWKRSIVIWIVVLGSGVLMHGYASMWLNHTHTYSFHA